MNFAIDQITSTSKYALFVYNILIDAENKVDYVLFFCIVSQLLTTRVDIFDEYGVKER